MIVSFIPSALLVFLSILSNVGASKPVKYGRDGWPLQCPQLVPVEAISEPAIGFALTTSYGTSAVKFRNGTTVAIGKIVGDLRYQQLMERLVRKQPEKGATISYVWHSITRYLRKARRNVFVQFGWATRDSDVLTLVSMLDQLKVLTEAHIGHQIKPYTTFVAFPVLSSLPRWLHEDALDISGLRFNRTMYRHGFYLRTSHAAVAGAGFGIHDGPLSGSPSGPLTRLMTIEYTENLLQVTYPHMNTIGNLFDGFYDDVIISITLGSKELKSLPNHCNAEEHYWQAVKSAILTLPTRNPILELGKLVIHGEQGHNPRLLTEVRQVIEELNRSSHDETRNFYTPFRYMAELEEQLAEMENPACSKVDTIRDPSYLAAIGAAEMLRRKWEELEWSCRVSDEEDVDGKVSETASSGSRDGDEGSGGLANGKKSDHDDADLPSSPPYQNHNQDQNQKVLGGN